MTIVDRRRFMASASTAAAGLAILQPGRTAAAAVPDELRRVDLHVHLSQEITFERLAELSRKGGFEVGLVEHPGPRYSRMTDDAALNAYLDRVAGCGFYKGLQPVDPGWRRLFGRETLARLDYVLMDALEIPDGKGRHAILWRDDFAVDDENAFMDRYVGFYLQILEEEQLDILASPTFLPKSVRARYDELWTEARMERVIGAAIRNGVALEINSMYRIPSRRFVTRAKRMGARFSFGTNGRTADVIGALDYSLETARACGLSPADIFVPRRDGRGRTR
jgi:histidinol phosphatase-like PHP family hydrolase